MDLLFSMDGLRLLNHPSNFAVRALGRICQDRDFGVQMVLSYSLRCCLTEKLICWHCKGFGPRPGFFTDKIVKFFIIFSPVPLHFLHLLETF